METFKLEKLIWTEDDFEIMDWHDSKVWGLLANPDEWEYLVDLDYILKWVHPEDGEKYFKFWVSPVTMVFENAYDVKIDIESRQGEITLSATGYKMFVRQKPILIPGQSIGYKERRGKFWARVGCQITSQCAGHLLGACGAYEGGRDLNR